MRQMPRGQIHCSSSEQLLENWHLRNPIDREFAINNCELLLLQVLQNRERSDQKSGAFNGGVLTSKSVC